MAEEESAQSAADGRLRLAHSGITMPRSCAMYPCLSAYLIRGAVWAGRASHQEAAPHPGPPILGRFEIKLAPW